MSTESALGFSFSHTLEVRDHCLCLHAQRAARALSRRFDEAFRPSGLTSGQFSILVSLNRPESPTIGAVSSLLAMDRTTLTAALKPLERAGYVVAAVDPNDRRARRLRLTPAGKALLDRVGPIWRQVHAAIEAAAPSVEFENLRAGLTIVVQTCARTDDASARRPPERLGLTPAPPPLPALSAAAVAPPSRHSPDRTPR
jgi:DNA-binding MarR family transcriptional regulator